MPDRNPGPERNPVARTAQDRLRVVEERLQLGTWSWEAAGNQTYWSPGLYALLGLDATVVRPSLSFFETLVHPGDQLAFEEPQSLAIDPRQRNRRFRIIRTDGQLRWLRGQAQTIFDRTGVAIGVNAVVIEITDREEERRGAASDRALLHAVAQLLDVGLWKADADGRLLDSIAAANGPSVSQTGQTSWRDSVHPPDLERLGIDYRDAVLRRGRYDVAPRIIQADGSLAPLYVSGMPLEPEIVAEPLWGGVTSLNALQRGGGAPPGATGSGTMSPAQLRACRAYLGWSAEELASHANVSVSTIRRLESGTGPRANPDSLRQIRDAVEAAGVTVWHDQDGQFYMSGPAG
jgi:PAS domain S-box-containing protein